MVDVQTLLEAFLNMPLRSVCLTDEASFVARKENPWSWDYSSAGLSGFLSY
jgi:hypothetical protein